MITELQQTKNYLEEGFSRSCLKRSPFISEPIINQAEIPAGVVINDTHLIGLYGARGNTSSNRRNLFGLTSIPYLRNISRENELMTRVGLYMMRNTIAEGLINGKIFYIAGDVIDSYAVKDVLKNMNLLDNYAKSRYEQAAKLGRDTTTAHVFWGMGNHDMAFTGPDSWIGFSGLNKRVVNADDFRQAVELFEHGYGSNNMPMDWLGRNDDAVFNQVQRWFLQRIHNGSDIGMFVQEGKAKGSVVGFFNSELDKPGSTQQDLLTAIKNMLPYTIAESTATKIIETYTQDYARQESLICELFSLLDIYQDTPFVIYTHDPLAMQIKLINRYALSSRLNHFNDSEKISKAVETITKKVKILGGHYHKAGNDKKVAAAKGIQIISGLSRVVAGPLAENTKGLCLSAFSDPDDSMQLVKGRLDKPELVSFSSMEVRQAYQHLKARMQPELL